MHRLIICLVAALIVISTGLLADDPRGQATDRDFVVLRTPKLQCMIGNNKSLRHDDGQHNAGYNGLFQVRSIDQQESPFVTAYAGLNLEHYFDARVRSENEVFFEPRYSPMSLERVGDTKVLLHQPPTKTFGVESWTLFTVRDPYYIDFSFRCVPRSDAFDGKFFGVFWASYINGPLDKSIYFLDAGSNLDQPKWRQFSTQQHNRDSTVLGQDDSLELNFRDSGSALYSSISPLRYSDPFFYGRFRNMVLVYAFRPKSGLRFTQSPSGGGSNKRGDDTNPAWDFQLVVPRVQVGKEYKLEGRLIYKRWQGRTDVIAEIRKYQQTESR